MTFTKSTFHKRCSRLMVILALIFLPSTIYASVEDNVIRQSDRAREIKAVATKPEGAWLAVPIPISNPTIGTGLEAAVLYLHPKTSADPGVPNATSGVVGLYTDTDSWFAGGFHDGYLKEDKYRIRILAGTGEFELDYFGIGDDPIFSDNPLQYSLQTDALILQSLRRLPFARNWYLGLRYMFIDSEVKFDIGNSFPGLPTISDTMTTSGLGLMATYDSRDNNYYPVTGSHFELVWTRDDDAWGSDFEFDKLTSFYNHYFSITEKDTLAVRGTLTDTDGDTPFFLLANLRMRGFPAGRYKDNSSLSGHIEWRRKLLPRWGLIVFGEAGSTADSVDNLFSAETIESYGAGVRWQVTKEKKLNLGIDVGFSGSDQEIYVQIGERF